MAAKFEITKARVGHIEPIGNQLKLVVYTSRKIAANAAGEAQFASDRLDLVVFGQRAKDWAKLTLGQVISKIAGEIRVTNQGDLQLVAWNIDVEGVAEVVETTEALAEALTEALAEDIATVAEEVATPKAKRSRKAKQAA